MAIDILIDTLNDLCAMYNPVYGFRNDYLESIANTVIIPCTSVMLMNDRIVHSNLRSWTTIQSPEEEPTELPILFTRRNIQLKRPYNLVGVRQSVVETSGDGGQASPGVKLDDILFATRGLMESRLNRIVKYSIQRMDEGQLVLTVNVK
jgi:hypothetical protein